MNINLTTKSSACDLLIVPVFEGGEVQTLKTVLNGEVPLSDLIQTDFKNKVGAFAIIYTPKLPNSRLMILGLGDRKGFNAAVLRKAVQTAGVYLTKQDWAVLLFDAKNIGDKYLESLSFALIFGSFVFNDYKQDTKTVEKTVRLLVKNLSNATKKSIEAGIIQATACNNARSLANHPGNVATPTHLAKHALATAKKYGFRCKILGPAEIKKLGMGLLEGVSKGSDEPAKFIILEHLPAGRQAAGKSQSIVLVGKGLTFDSGGISIKPADRMEEMKFDMAGGATVLGIFEAVAKLKLPIHLVGLIPTSENLISGKALKPGDVLKSYDGKTVEVINTDAEGRLILADAITYAKKHYNPRLLIDYATLTGAVIVALGDEYTGLMANTNRYDKLLAACASISAEKFWKLPLPEEYKEHAKSFVADIKNVGEKSVAGAINGGIFLQSFVGKTDWIHMDIAGTAWRVLPKPDMPVGATGWGVFLTVQFLRRLKK